MMDSNFIIYYVYLTDSNSKDKTIIFTMPNDIWAFWHSVFTKPSGEFKMKSVLIIRKTPNDVKIIANSKQGDNLVHD